MSEEEVDCCPLCMEELDLTDKTFDACRCGYQVGCANVCLWCWHQIKNEYNGLCPACRAPVVRRTKQRKQKEKIEKKSTAPPRAAPINRKSLVNVRVMQRNLVYVIGLPVHYADDDLLRSKDCFGQYGRIVKAVVNKSHLNSDRNNATASAYITFAHKPDAQNCIDLIDGYILDGSLLRASFGTTKYCNFFLRNLSCNNPECLYLHELGETDDSFTKEEMQTAGKGCFREIGPYEDRRGNAFPSLTASMREAASTDTRSASSAAATALRQAANGGGASSDAQRKAHSAAAIAKLKQHTERDDDKKTNTQTRPKPETSAAASPQSSTSTQASSTAASPAKEAAPAKPALYVDTSRSNGATAQADVRPAADEPLWNQPFPKPQMGAPDDQGPPRAMNHVFSPFGMGFDGGIGRKQQGLAPPPGSSPPHHLPLPPPQLSPPDATAFHHDALQPPPHVSAWNFEFAERQPTPPSTVGHSTFEFASVDAAFTSRNESSEALAGLLGVQLSAKPLLGSSMLPPPPTSGNGGGNGGSNSSKARGSRFSFANKADSPPPHPPSSTAPMEDYNPFGGSGMYGVRSPEKRLFDESSSSAFLSMPPPSSSADASISGLAFLQQMLPNVNISYGREPTEQHLHRPAYTQSFDQKSSWSAGDIRADVAADPFWARSPSAFDRAPLPPPPSSASNYSFQDPAIVTQGGAPYGSSPFYQDEHKPPFGRPPYASPQHSVGRS
ncbi:Aste57867_22916 [Aphanomyces stellatus]|uniref:Aste57867_22916 protein n=1 Tax=Aphanomyces stellatus TaxID=120398 RepID=A0A485LM18_9STRA|nr:hypothetical protein As57867_022845 [Aphanomyces stellatus]VFT99566.1 Aste57867_22916 [Aphanomyces stellatus]